jgi:hypothetical protein
MLDLKPPVCNVTFSTQDLVFSPILSVEDEGKKPSTSIGKICRDSDKFYFKNNLRSKIMQKIGFQGSGLGKEPIKPIWRSKFESLGFGEREGPSIACNRSDVSSSTAGLNKSCSSKECISCSHCNRDGHIEDKCLDLHPCNMCGLKSHSEESCWNRDYSGQSSKVCIEIDYGWIDGSCWQKVIKMLRRLYKPPRLHVKSGIRGSRFRYVSEVAGDFLF